jgi:hypothetical protein
MIIFFECATITDSVSYFAEADKSRLRPDELAMLKETAQIRLDLKTYTQMDFLVSKVQAGENIMVKKVLIDHYHESQVDLVIKSIYLAKIIRKTQSKMSILLPISVYQLSVYMQ